MLSGILSWIVMCSPVPTTESLRGYKICEGILEPTVERLREGSRPELVQLEPEITQSKARREHEAPWLNYGAVGGSACAASGRCATSSSVAAQNNLKMPRRRRGCSRPGKNSAPDLFCAARGYFTRGLYHIQSFLSPIVWPGLSLNALVKLQACTWPSTNKVGAMKGIGSFFRAPARISFPFPPCQ